MIAHNEGGRLGSLEDRGKASAEVRERAVAIYIPIRKIEETEAYVDYSFKDALGHEGIVRIDKLSGDFQPLKDLPGSRSVEYLARVVYKLQKHWSNGEFPDATCWAA